MEGEAARAFLNISRIARSDSPTNLFKSLSESQLTRLRNEDKCLLRAL